MGKILYLSLALILGGSGLLCLLVPRKILNAITKFKEVHVRIIGIIVILIMLIIIFQLLTVSSLVNIINTFGNGGR